MVDSLALAGLVSTMFVIAVVLLVGHLLAGAAGARGVR